MHEHENFTALRSMQRLQNAHQTFMETLLRKQDVEPPLGTVISTSEGVALQCLGYNIAIRHRPIAKNAGELAYEYEFLAKYWDEDCVVMRIYMSTQGSLYRNADFDQYFEDIATWSIRNSLITETFTKLLQSKVFAPN